MKTCSKCGIEKSLTDFYDKRGKVAGFAACKLCCGTGNKSKRKVRSTKNGHARDILTRRKYYAKKGGYPFSLDIELQISLAPEFCPVLGIKLDWGCIGKLHATDNSPSLDKIKPELGYVEGNVAWMSHKANTMKSNATLQEIEALANWMKAQQ